MTRVLLQAVSSPASTRGVVQGAAYVDAYGADPTGATDSTAAFIAARDALPPITVYADQTHHTAPSQSCPLGTIRLGATSGVVGYKLGGLTTTTTTTCADVVGACPATFTLASTAGFSKVYGGQFVVMTSNGSAVIAYTGVSGNTVTGCSFLRGAGYEGGATDSAVISGAAVQLDVGNLGPFCSLEGPGKASCYVSYYGAGDAIRAYNPVQVASGSGLFNLPGEAGRFVGFTVQGGAHLTGPGSGIDSQDVFCGVGAAGLHVGDTEGFTFDDVVAQFFTGGQIATPVLTLSSVNTGGSLTAGTWNWQVTAVNEAGETANSNDVFSTVVPASGLANLSWTAVPGARFYNVYRRATSGAVNGALVAKVPAGTTTYTDTGTGTTSHRFQQLNVVGNNNVWFDDFIGWTENMHGKITSRGGDNQAMFSVAPGSNGTQSFEYNHLWLKVYAFAGQNGLVFKDGPLYRNGSLHVTANFADASVSAINSAIAFTGKGIGSIGIIQYSVLNVVCELDGAGANAPMTIRFGTPFTGGPVIQWCTGVLSFVKSSTATWQASNWSPSTGTSFNFAGIINGDSNLHPNNGVAAFAVAGAIGYGPVPLSASGGMQMQLGDVAFLTLTQNITWAPSNTMAGPQKKTIVLTQNGTGNFTVTWPKPGSPTVASPAVYWAGGVAPTMTAAAGATDIYELVTYDGIKWYGRVIAQNVS